MMDYCHFSDFDEFLGMMKNKANEADQESDLRDAFKIFDRDNNGYIDMKELKQVGFSHVDLSIFLHPLCI